jgi:hypothetical protein
MSLKDAFAGIREAQAPELPSAQAPKHLSAEAHNRSLSAQAFRLPSSQAPERPGAQAPKPLPLMKTGKSSHPEYEPVKIYIRKRTRKDAWRKWEDAQGGDFSDLVQMLLERYLGA